MAVIPYLVSGKATINRNPANLENNKINDNKTHVFLRKNTAKVVREGHHAMHYTQKYHSQQANKLKQDTFCFILSVFFGRNRRSET